MDLFRDLGRRAERIKRRVQSAAEATHECVDCETLFESDAENCPVCGGDVVALD